MPTLCEASQVPRRARALALDTCAVCGDEAAAATLFSRPTASRARRNADALTSGFKADPWERN